MRPRQAGFTLIETVVYLSALFVLLGAGYMAMYRCIDRSVALRRNAEGLTSALRAGEHWRADVRSATGPIRSENESGLLFPVPSWGGGLSAGEAHIIRVSQREFVVDEFQPKFA